jgi:glutamyl-tRNA synthetase
MATMNGRFAPSPTGRLHLGNLRTAAVAWMSARSSGRGFLVRMEDLDPHQSRREHEESQHTEMASIGMDWNGEVVRQSERFPLYEDAISDLRARGLVYECFCSRREVRAEIEAAPQAPHLPPGSYPGTCRNLTPEEREAKRASGRPPALRLRTDGEVLGFEDRVHGRVEAGVDDVVLRRNDGTPAYNLAVVVDDALQGVTEVVRGDDLLASTPRHLHLQSLLGLPHPEYAHVPLVMGDDGERLSKRTGSTTLEGLAESGVGPDRVVAWIGWSLGLCNPSDQVELGDLLARFEWSAVPREAVPPPKL